MKRYWLFKSEPSVFSFEDLKASPARTTRWDGVRNYQARNLLRDEVQRGDDVLFYHSSRDPPAVVGIARVVREAYPDPTQFEARSPHFDPASKREAPRWLAVDIGYEKALAKPVTLPELRATASLAELPLLRRGNRLSIQPVSPQAWRIILALGGA